MVYDVWLALLEVRGTRRPWSFFTFLPSRDEQWNSAAPTNAFCISQSVIQPRTTDHESVPIIGKWPSPASSSSFAPPHLLRWTSTPEFISAVWPASVTADHYVQPAQVYCEAEEGGGSGWIKVSRWNSPLIFSAERNREMKRWREG